jgi:RNA-directed DNA polymerase
VSSFTGLDQSWLVKFLEHRIADKRVLRLIQKWLRAGVIEDGAWSSTETGTAQGASVSPLLSNVFLHYVFDLWADQWRRRYARGDVILVRFADDYVAGFEHREDAERFLADLRGRFAEFGLELHPEKTRLIEFGRFAAQNRERRNDRKPDTFDFLGLTHICAEDRHGRFKLKRVTSKKKMRAKLKSVKTEMRRRMHLPIPEQGRWLARVLQRHFNYYAVPDNSEALRGFREAVIRLWRKAPARRSQKGRITWERLRRLADRWLPRPRILHPWPSVRFDARTRGRSPVVDAHAGICAGGAWQRASLPRCPPEPPLRGEASNCPQVHWLKTVVLNVVGKGAARSRQVWVGKMSDEREFSAVDVSKAVR